MTQTTPSANRWVSRASSLLRRSLRAAMGCSRSENRRLGHRDRRVEPRLKVHFEARIADESGSIEVRGVDINRDGALLLATQPLTPNSVVFVQLKSFGLMGFAQVRHCTERGAKNYAIGVEFPRPLMKKEVGTWQFHCVRQTDAGWSPEWEASMNLSPAVRAA